MKTIRYSGETPYHGSDRDTLLTIDPGESAEVTDAKAEQLLADFPEHFTAAAGASAPRKTTERAKRTGGR